MLNVVDITDGSNPAIADGDGRSLLDQIVRDGARQMLAAALQAEVAAYIDQHADQIDEDGRRLVVRNGSHQPREVVTAAGAIEVKAPRINDKRTDPVTGERRRFSSKILPAWARKSGEVTTVLPLLYLHGLSTNDFGPALEQFLGTGDGLSPAVITRLTKQWQSEAAAFGARDLSGTDYVYMWVDGIHLKVRLEQEKLCLLERRYRPVQYLSQPLIAAGGLAKETCSNELVPTWLSPHELRGIQTPSGLLGELREEHELRPSVSLPEAVHDVQFAPDFSQLPNESVGISAPQET